MKLIDFSLFYWFQNWLSHLWTKIRRSILLVLCCWEITSNWCWRLHCPSGSFRAENRHRQIAFIKLPSSNCHRQIAFVVKSVSWKITLNWLSKSQNCFFFLKCAHFVPQEMYENICLINFFSVPKVQISQNW